MRRRCPCNCHRSSPGGAYKTDPSHSSLVWSLNHSGLSRYTARFTGVYARLDWKPEKPEQSALTVTIDPLSVRTDFPWAEMGDFDAEIGVVKISSTHNR
ncbi:YceI family protein [Gemmobacter lanyuensis]